MRQRLLRGPACEAMGTATARMQCPANRRVVANVVDPQAQTSKEVYAGTEWAEVVARRIEPGHLVKAGSVFDFKCTYQNSQPRIVNQGFTTEDEMCVFWGLVLST